MLHGHTVAVVIPAYNEEAHIGTVIDSMPDFVDRVYAIDDASRDDTWDVLTSAARRQNGPQSEGGEFDRWVLPIKHTQNRGAGGAVLTGYEHALADEIDVIAVMDGDGQMDPRMLHRIVEPVALGQVAYAKGNRLTHPQDRAEMSTWRLFGNVLLTGLTRIASGYWDLADPQNGFTAISRTALRDLPLDRLYPKYGFLNDVLIHLNMNRERIADVTHAGLYGDEVSGIKYRTFIPGLSALLAVRFVQRLVRLYLIKRLHPLIVCVLVGLPVFLLGLGGIGYTLHNPAVPGFLGTMSAVTVLGIGTLLLVLGSWFDLRENEQLRIVFPPSDGELHAPPERVPISLEGEIEAVGDGGRVESD